MTKFIEINLFEMGWMFLGNLKIQGTKGRTQCGLRRFFFVPPKLYTTLIVGSLVTVRSFE
jgi:hypothetical protein